jgi:23S rRNA pseudouridine2605 synthase
MNKASDSSIKIHTFLAHAGIASRRKSEELVAEGKVKVNGQIAQIGQRVNPQTDKVELNGKKVGEREKTVTYLIYKPAGVVSTTSDELNRKNVIDFLQKEIGRTEKLPRLYPVGRLDLDSEGLMILTNDGELTHTMTHPSFEVEKTYRITVLGHPTEKALAHLEKGVLLKEGMTAPAHVEVIDSDDENTILEITIHEGRYHQVKRMMLRVGYEVTRLVRVKMGEYSLEDLHDKKWVEIKHLADNHSRNE